MSEISPGYVSRFRTLRTERVPRVRIRANVEDSVSNATMVAIRVDIFSLRNPLKEQPDKSHTIKI